MKNILNNKAFQGKGSKINAIRSKNLVSKVHPNSRLYFHALKQLNCSKEELNLDDLIIKWNNELEAHLQNMETILISCGIKKTCS